MLRDDLYRISSARAALASPTAISSTATSSAALFPTTLTESPFRLLFRRQWWDRLRDRRQLLNAQPQCAPTALERRKDPGRESLPNHLCIARCASRFAKATREQKAYRGPFEAL